MTDSPRIFARQKARELTAEEIENVFGGAAEAGDNCFYCHNVGGHDTQVYGRDV